MPDNRVVEITLGTQEDEAMLTELFSLTKEQVEGGLDVTDVFGHAFNQTLQRDGFYGAWCDTWAPSKKWGKEHYGIKLTSPTDDLSAYERLIPRWLEAGKKGLELWQKHEQAIQANAAKQGTDGEPVEVKFLLPFGLAMANTRSVQLLHYPPTVTLDYMDYLYSATNRRWESLLILNGYPGAQHALCETITDLIPIAAPGGESGQKVIGDFTSDFVDYDKAMLAARIWDQRMPVVAYGGPVRDWISTTFGLPMKTVSSGQQSAIQVNEIVELPIFEQQGKVQVLCANHPSEYLYLTKSPPESGTEREKYLEQRKSVMTQDLISAGWQTRTSQDWDLDKHAALAKATHYWTEGDGVERLEGIIASQDTEFGYGVDKLAEIAGFGS